MTPDDIIRMFFGGDFAGMGGHSRGGFHFHSGGRRQRGQGGDGQTAGQGQGGPMVMLMQLMPMLLVFITMILPSLMAFGGNDSRSNYGRGGGMEGTYFSLDRQRPFTLEKTTEKGSVKYFVQPQRRGSWGYQRNKNPRMEREVEGAYLNRLIRECEEEMEKEQQRLERIHSTSTDAKERRKLMRKMMKGKSRMDVRDNKQCRKLDDYVEEM